MEYFNQKETVFVFQFEMLLDLAGLNNLSNLPHDLGRINGDGRHCHFCQRLLRLGVHWLTPGLVDRGHSSYFSRVSATRECTSKKCTPIISGLFIPP